jgi:hypothetical protein
VCVCVSTVHRSCSRSPAPRAGEFCAKFPSTYWGRLWPAAGGAFGASTGGAFGAAQEGGSGGSGALPAGGLGGLPAGGMEEAKALQAALRVSLRDKGPGQADDAEEEEASQALEERGEREREREGERERVCVF